MVFLEQDKVIEHRAASTADPSFSDSVLPRAPQACSHRFDPAPPSEFDDFIAELSVLVEPDITVPAVSGSQWPIGAASRFRKP